ncbi:Lrp/AsnC family transcriptional regulator [Pontibaca salina]|uniref:AsnC family transcriptional regulator n=1 Tax=Pontibaca salina TaxID=2795731 RepID=A0A934M1A8_9RHOB|nr:AsnC family transcriptional regulator [Pontibaca salina]MBI6630850.1 AsnC family transcriptional regulator [Pontibaca salina]
MAWRRERQTEASLDTARDGRRPTGDDLDYAIVKLLEVDGRKAFSEIAHELNVSEGTIRNRVGRMKEAGVLRIVAIADPAATEYQTSVMLGLKVAQGHTPQQVAARLEKEAFVVYILWVAGRFDLVVEVVCDQQEHLLEFLEAEFHSAEDLAAIEVMPGLRNFKNQFLLKRIWATPKET